MFTTYFEVGKKATKHYALYEHIIVIKKNVKWFKSTYKKGCLSGSVS